MSYVRNHHLTPALKDNALTFSSKGLYARLTGNCVHYEGIWISLVIIDLSFYSFFFFDRLLLDGFIYIYI